MLLRNQLLLGSAMTAAEQATGRFMRGPDHDAATPAPSPEPAPAASEGEGADDFGQEDDFTKFENSVDTTEEGDDDSPKTPKDGDADKDVPPASDDQQGAPPEEKPVEQTAEQRLAERERELDRRESERLAARVAELEGKKPESEAEEEARKPDERPDPDKYEFGEADGKYLSDMARFEVRQELAEQRQREAQEIQQRELKEATTKMETDWDNKVSSKELTEKYSDFSDVVVKGADRGDWALSPVGALLVKGSEVGTDVAYHLASNPDESRRIAGLNPVEQALEIGRIEGRYLNAEAPAAPAPVKRATDAPTPPQQRSRGAGGRFAVEADTEDFAAFDKMADGVLS